MARVPHPCSTCGQPCWGVNCRSCGWKSPRPEERCEFCGVTFPRKGSRRARFCSLDCSQSFAKAAYGKRQERTCEQCGAMFYKKPSAIGVSRHDGNTRGRFCSKRCAGTWRAQQPGWGIAHKPPKPKPPKPIKYPSSRVYFRTCDMCGRLFAARGASAKRCSTQCKIDHSGVRVKDLYHLATQFDAKTGQYPGADWRKALLDYLVERDGDRCGVCNRKVDITLKSGPKGSRRGPSVDHVVPRSLGGSDDPSNLRLTHWGCNQKRGNRGGNEQLMLVG